MKELAGDELLVEARVTREVSRVAGILGPQVHATSRTLWRP
ncbi:hypothetical protein [Nonomuraea phyllanthi]|nr:hypothetical protein [Nonomuraea phyllanthi]